MNEIPFTGEDVLKTTLTHHVDSKRRLEIDLEVFWTKTDGLGIEYGEQEEGIHVHIESNDLYLECTDYEGKEYKIRLL